MGPSFLSNDPQRHSGAADVQRCSVEIEGANLDLEAKIAAGQAFLARLETLPGGLANDVACLAGFEKRRAVGDERLSHQELHRSIDGSEAAFDASHLARSLVDLRGLAGSTLKRP